MIYIAMLALKVIKMINAFSNVNDTQNAGEFATLDPVRLPGEIERHVTRHSRHVD